MCASRNKYYYGQSFRHLGYLQRRCVPNNEYVHQIKSFAMDILNRSSYSKVWINSLLSSLDKLWSTIDKSLAKESKTSHLIPPLKFPFTFFTKSIIGADPKTWPHIAKSGHKVLQTWLLLQALPTKRLGFLQPFEETIHNLLFLLGFNGFAGFSEFLPTLLSNPGKGTAEMKKKLRDELRSHDRGTSTLTFESATHMPLIQSYVYKTLRMNPLQYGRARKDFRLSSYD
ncbi:hypothetical protein Droror1_Dr00003029 [Drosera rotundifolia]